MAQMQSSITHHGFTWTFDMPYLCGRYLNGVGDWWVRRDLTTGTVKVISITPAPYSETMPGSITWASGPWYRNGSTINLGTTGGHGFDAAMQKNQPSYSHTQNVGYPGGVNVGGGGSPVSVSNPLTLSPPADGVLSLISGCSNSSNASNNPFVGLPFHGATYTPGGSYRLMSRYNVLTVVYSEPAATAFRPSWCGTVKFEYDEADVDFSVLPKINYPTGYQLPACPNGAERPGGQIPTEPAYSTLLANHFDRVWLDWGFEAKQQGFRSVWNSGGQDNHSDNALSVFGAGMVASLLNKTNTEKRELVLRLVQIGIDYLGVYRNMPASTGGSSDGLQPWFSNSAVWEYSGFLWRGNGGHSHMGFPAILYAGALLDDKATFYNWRNHQWGIGRHCIWKAPGSGQDYGGDFDSSSWTIHCPGDVDQPPESPASIEYNNIQHKFNGYYPEYAQQQGTNGVEAYGRFFGSGVSPSWINNASYRTSDSNHSFCAVDLFSQALDLYPDWPTGLAGFVTGGSPLWQLKPYPGGLTENPFRRNTARYMSIWRALTEGNFRSVQGLDTNLQAHRFHFVHAMWRHLVEDGNLSVGGGPQSLTATFSGGGRFTAGDLTHSGTQSLTAQFRGGGRLGIGSGSISGEWAADGWGARTPFQINWTQLPLGSESNISIPFQVQLDPAKAQPFAQEVFITKNSSTDAIPVDQETYDPSTGIYRGFMRLAMVTTGADQIFFAYHDNPAALQQSNASAVFPTARLVLKLQPRFGGTTRGTMKNVGTLAGGFPSTPTFIGLPEWPTEPGLFSQAFGFEDLTPATYIDCGPANFDPDMTSVVLLVRVDGAATHDQRLISKANDTAEQGHVFMISTLDDGGTLKYRFRLKTGTDDGAGTHTLIGSSDVELGTYQVVVATYSSSTGTMRLYVDGALDGEGQHPTGGQIRQNAYNCWIGANDSTLLKQLDGAIDQVTVWDEELSPTHVAKLSALLLDTASYIEEFEEQQFAPGSPEIAVSASEAGVGSDVATAVLEIPVAVSEGGVGTDGTGETTIETPEVQVSVSEAGVGMDAASALLDIPVSVSEGGVGSDAIILAQDIDVGVSEFGFGSDSASAIAVEPDPEDALLDANAVFMAQQAGEKITYYPGGDLSNGVSIWAIVRVNELDELSIDSGSNMVDRATIHVPRISIPFVDPSKDKVAISFLGGSATEISRVTSIIDDSHRIWDLEVIRG